MSIRRTILLRVYLAYALVFILAAAVVVQAVRVQLVQGTHWRNLADSLSTEYINVEAVRGNIYAADGSLIATSLPEYELRMDVNTSSLSNKLFNEKVDSLALCLSRLFRDKSANEYARKLRKARYAGERYFLIKRNVTYPQLKQVKTFPIFNLGRYKGGLIVVQKNKRVKPFKLLASRTIGYKVDGVQPVGLEGAYDSYLGGQSGKRLMQKISGGVWMPINDDEEIAPLDGNDIISTIDINIQDVAQNALLEQLTKHDAKHGCVVLMEVETGEIKAIANLSRVSPGEYVEKYNYAVGESTEPGSTFKLASFIAGFEDGIFDIEDTINTADGKVKYYDHWTRDTKEGGYGTITLKKAFEVSSNVAISKAIVKGYRSEPEKFVARLRKMKLDKPVGLQIPGEGLPRIKGPDDDSWSGISLPQISIGYEVTMTPLQILTFYNAIANNGRMVAPLFVKEIQKLGKPVEKFETKVIQDEICSEKTLKKVRSLLEGVVENGTATNLNNAIYKIAGKTGTAQIADKTLGYKQKGVSYQASFCGYFPADNPKYSIIVVVNSPSNNVYYGNVVAGPIFKEIADKVYASSLQMHKSIDEEYRVTAQQVPLAKAGYRQDTEKIYNRIGISASVNKDAEWVSAVKNDNSVALVERKTIEGLVPNVVGMGLQDALYLMENAGLKTIVKGRGKVVRQSLPVGIRAVNGQHVMLVMQ